MTKRATPLNVHSRLEKPSPGQYRDCVRLGEASEFLGTSEGFGYWNVTPEDGEATDSIEVYEIEPFDVSLNDRIAFINFYIGGFVASPLDPGEAPL